MFGNQSQNIFKNPNKNVDKKREHEALYYRTIVDITTVDCLRDY